MKFKHYLSFFREKQQKFRNRSFYRSRKNYWSEQRPSSCLRSLILLWVTLKVESFRFQKKTHTNIICINILYCIRGSVYLDVLIVKHLRGWTNHVDPHWGHTLHISLEQILKFFSRKRGRTTHLMQCWHEDS